jgi:hypothetical protein
MKNIVTFLLCINSLQLLAQISVETTRITHLLKQRNQATFRNSLVLQIGEQINLKELYDDGYFRIIFKNEEFYIYYPYLNKVEGIETIKSHLLSKKSDSLFTQPVSEYKAKPRSVTRSRSSSSHYIHTGPRGGKYYINSKGKKTYLKH